MSLANSLISGSICLRSALETVDTAKRFLHPQIPASRRIAVLTTTPATMPRKGSEVVVVTTIAAGPLMLSAGVMTPPRFAGIARAVPMTSRKPAMEAAGVYLASRGSKPESRMMPISSIS